MRFAEKANAMCCMLPYSGQAFKPQGISVMQTLYGKSISIIPGLLQDPLVLKHTWAVNFLYAVEPFSTGYLEKANIMW